MPSKNKKDINHSINDNFEIDASIINLFSDLSLGIIFHDENGKVIDANPAALKLLNASLSELQGKTAINRNWKTIRPNGEDFPMEEQPANLALRTGKPVENVIIGINNQDENNYTWILVNSVPRFKDNDSKPYQVYTTFTDISKQINIEKLLIKEKNLHELLIKTSREFIGVPAHEVDQVINNALADLGNYIGADRFYIFDYDFINNTSTNTYEWCAQDILPQIESLKNLPIDIFSPWTKIHQEGKSIIIDDVLSLELNSPIRELLVPQDIKSLIAVPLINGKKCIGFVGFDAVKNHHKFSTLEQTLLNVFASNFVNLINRRDAEAALIKSNNDLGERHKELECIYEVNQLGEIDSLSFDAYFEELVQMIPKAFQFPQKTSVKIIVPQKLFKSSPYSETNNSISIDFKFQNRNQIGSLVVFNPQNEPFLKEEYQLLENIKRIVEQTFERKESKELLLASEEKYKELFMSSPEAFLLIDNETIVDCNLAACKLIELKREDIIGKSPADLSPKTQPGNRVSESYAKDILKSAYAEGIKSFEWLHTKGNGKPFLAEVRLSITKLNGKDLLFTSWRDVTKQKEAEEEMRKFRIIADQAYYGSAITTLDGEITYCNAAFASMHGYEVEELIGKQIPFLHNEEQLRLVMPLLDEIKTKGGFDATEVGHLKKDGSTFPTLMTAKLIFDQHHNPLFLSATLIDISERKKIEQEIIDLNQNLEKKIFERTKELENSNELLVQSYKEAEKANRSKTDFLSRMSHELRTPMNSILGFAQLLEMSELNARDQKAVSRILDSGDHLLNLINEVLDISRIEAGKISISLEPVEINTLIGDVNESLIPLANQKGIIIHNLNENQLPCYVKADTQRLKQVLINLANNAIKYNNQNGEVWVSYEKLTQKDFVKITIEDNGIGIDESDLTKIFKPFERAAYENSNTEGTGLGLSVVKQLTVLMGGNFGVESKKGLGSKFWIELPISQSDLDRIIANNDLDQPHIEKASFNGNVLYIEDNKSNIELIEQVLNTKRPNINLISSMHGYEALDLAKKHAPKIILLDLNLPDIHGSKVLAELTLDPLTRNIPVIVLSADATPSQVNELMTLGAKNYLTKPVNINEFLREIDSYIQH